MKARAVKPQQMKLLSRKKFRERKMRPHLRIRFLQIIRRVVIPQALRSSVLPLTNLLVATMLTTALASQVPMNPADLTGLVAHINTHAVGGVTAFLISAVMYCATAVVIGQVGSMIDRKVRILR